MKKRQQLLAFALSASFCFVSAAKIPDNLLVVAKNIEDIVSLDPAEAFEFSGGEVVANIYLPLVQYDIKDPSQVIPAVASSWAATEDGKGILFTLDNDMKFASGNPVTFDDVLFSFERVLKLKKAPEFILSQLGWSVDNINEMVSSPESGKVLVKWAGDFGPSYVLNVLAARPASIVDKKTVMSHEKAGDLGNAWLNNHSAGTGSYQLKLYKPKEVLIMETNNNSEVAPKIPSVLIKNTTEPSTQRLLLESGDADIVRDLGPDQIAALSGNDKVTISDHPGSAVHFISLNQKYNKLTNPALWQAMRYLVDYQGITEQLQKGQMRVHQAFLPVGFAGALTDTPYQLDVEKAKSILAEAGLKDIEISMDLINSPRFMDIAQSLQATMGKAGIKLVLKPGTGSQVITRYRARQHEGMLLYWGPDFFDPHSNAKAFSYNADNDDNNYQSTTTWRNAWFIPELSKKTLAALKESDPAKRAEMYVELQKSVQADSPIIIMFQEQNQVALGKGVKGYIQGSTPDLVRYHNVTK